MNNILRHIILSYSRGGIFISSIISGKYYVDFIFTTPRPWHDKIYFIMQISYMTHWVPFTFYLLQFSFGTSKTYFVDGME